MNADWSRLNKTLQLQLGKAASFSQGIETLLTLRQELMDALWGMKTELQRADFNAMPFPAANGYHSKTIAYSVWHIFRIEDIVAHRLIARDAEVFCRFQEKIGAPIATTGNELMGQQIADFSAALDLDALYAYAAAVKDSTETLLKQLSYRDLSRKFGEEDRERLRRLQVVDTNTCGWLIDYWCGKNVLGLIRMPFSRHWIMHVEAALRIRNRLCVAKEGTRQTAQKAAARRHTDGSENGRAAAASGTDPDVK